MYLVLYTNGTGLGCHALLQPTLGLATTIFTFSHSCSFFLACREPLGYLLPLHLQCQVGHDSYLRIVPHSYLVLWTYGPPVTSSPLFWVTFHQWIMIVSWHCLSTNCCMYLSEKHRFLRDTFVFSRFMCMYVASCEGTSGTEPSLSSVGVHTSIYWSTVFRWGLLLIFHSVKTKRPSWGFRSSIHCFTTTTLYFSF